MRTFLFTLSLASFLPALAAAQATGTGTPPPDAKALVEAPKDGAAAPTIEKSIDSTTAAVSAGGMLSAGNTKSQALTLNGAFELRRGANGFGATALGNYASSALRGEDSRTTAENFQARVRYDRYLLEKLSLFLLVTERYDRFQGIASRTNIDPGVKYIFWMPESSAFWGELGYDFQYDIRTRTGQYQVDPDTKELRGDLPLYNKTMSDHSARAFLGFRHAFNKEVTLSTGVEYLQSLIKTELAGQNTRINFDATLAAKIVGGLAAGVGGSVRYDKNPLGERAKTDMAITLSLIYAFSDVKAAEEEKCPACPEIPPCPNAAEEPPLVPGPTSPDTPPPSTEPVTPPPASDTPPPPPTDTQLR